MELVNLLLWFAIVLVVFLVGRAVALWYWKVNEGIALFHEVSASLARMEAAAGIPRPTTGPGPAAPGLITPSRRCSSCGQEVVPWKRADGGACPACGAAMPAAGA